MDINNLLEKHHISKYYLSKATNIPYSTITDICSGKTQLENCNVKTVYKLSCFFNVSIESLVYINTETRYDFDIFKSNICHKYKEMGFKNFITVVLQRDIITDYIEKGWYPEALYTLAMLDYISRINNIPLCTKYDSYRTAKLNQMIYPSSVVVEAKIMKNDDILQKAKDNAIPEFLRFNIIEGQVFDVV